jgi:hypothetical protein
LYRTMITAFYLDQVFDFFYHFFLMQLSDTAECSVHCRNYCKLCALENSMKTPWLTPLYLVYISFWNHFHHIFILLNASVVFITLRKSLTASWLVIYTLTHCPWYLLLWKFRFVRLRERERERERESIEWKFWVLLNWFRTKESSRYIL